MLPKPRLKKSNWKLDLGNMKIGNLNSLKLMRVQSAESLGQISLMMLLNMQRH
jgi:hypothetical protein